MPLFVRFLHRLACPRCPVGHDYAVDSAYNLALDDLAKGVRREPSSAR